MTRSLGSGYVLEELLGQGAFGAVWRGHDLAGTPLAFKLLHDRLAGDPATVDRFLRERRLLLSLDHPRLVKVRDLVVEGQTMALVMDLVTGGDLKQFMENQGPIPLHEACRIGAAIADGLAAIHAAGVVHRDLKPENILLEPGDDEVSPKIGDFGISKLVEADVTTTVLAGTPRYMAPELFDDAPPTPASDLYAFGVLLYQLVAAEPPFRATSFASAMKAHLQETPERPAGLPDDVWDLISCLMAKDPASRPASATEVAVALGEAGGTADDLPDDATLIRVSEVPASTIDATIVRTQRAATKEDATSSSDDQEPSQPQTKTKKGLWPKVGLLLAALAVGTALVVMVATGFNSPSDPGEEPAVDPSSESETEATDSLEIDWGELMACEWVTSAEDLIGGSVTAGRWDSGLEPDDESADWVLYDDGSCRLEARPGDDYYGAYEFVQFGYGVEQAGDDWAEYDSSGEVAGLKYDVYLYRTPDGSINNVNVEFEANGAGFYCGLADCDPSSDAWPGQVKEIVQFIADNFSR